MNNKPPKVSKRKVIFLEAKMAWPEAEMQLANNHFNTLNFINNQDFSDLNL